VLVIEVSAKGCGIPLSTSKTPIDGSDSLSKLKSTGICPLERDVDDSISRKGPELTVGIRTDWGRDWLAFSIEETKDCFGSMLWLKAMRTSIEAVEKGTKSARRDVGWREGYMVDTSSTMRERDRYIWRSVATCSLEFKAGIKGASRLMKRARTNSSMTRFRPCSTAAPKRKLVNSMSK
jgi:hypothetical protein